MNKLNEMVVKNALRNMFDKGYVNISTIKECLSICGVTAEGKALQLLSALHCVSFSSMDKELAESMPAMVIALFDGATVALDTDDLVFPADRPTTQLRSVTSNTLQDGIKRVLGISG